MCVPIPPAYCDLVLLYFIPSNGEGLLLVTYLGTQ